MSLEHSKLIYNDIITYITIITIISAVSNVNIISSVAKIILLSLTIHVTSQASTQFASIRHMNKSANHLQALSHISHDLHFLSMPLYQAPVKLC